MRHSVTLREAERFIEAFRTLGVEPTVETVSTQWEDAKTGELVFGECRVVKLGRTNIVANVDGVEISLRPAVPQAHLRIEGKL